MSSLGWILVSSVQRTFFSTHFLAKSSLSFLLLSALIGHHEVNPLYLRSWSRLLIADKDIPTSWKVFLTWPDVVKGFFLRQGKKFCDYPQWITADSFFLRIYQDFLVPAIGFFILMMACFTCINISLECWTATECKFNQTFLICHEIARNQAMKLLISQLSKYLWKWRNMALNTFRRNRYGNMFLGQSVNHDTIGTPTHSWSYSQKTYFFITEGFFFFFLEYWYVWYGLII